MESRAPNPAKPSRRLQLHLLFANVTSLSKKVMDYICVKRESYQMIALVEYQKLQEDLVEAQDKFIALSYKSWWTQATRTEAGGVSGVTSLHASRCFSSRGLTGRNCQRARTCLQCP